MRAFFIADTHWLWYAAGRHAASYGFRRPRVDYMSIRNQAASFLLNRWGDIYDLECYAFIVDSRGGMNRFIDLLTGFGYRVELCEDPGRSITTLIKAEGWDLVCLAAGNVEPLQAVQAGREEGRRVILAHFDQSEAPADLPVDAYLKLNGNVLYEAEQSARM